MTQIKMIATDVDGTFLNDQRQYNHDRFAAQLARLKTANIRFVVASGNHIGHLHKVFAATPAVQTFVAENGSLIIDQHHTLFETPVPTDVAHAVVDALMTDDTLRPQAFRLSGAHGTYVSRDSKPLDLDAQNYFFNNLVTVDDLRDVEDTIYKVNGEWPHSSVQHVVDQLNTRFAGQVHATPSGFGSIDIIAPHMNKAVGVTQLAKSWGIDPSEVAAFGDNGNDKEMIAHVGLGVAMRNGAEDVRNVADLVTPTDNNHDGVLDVIDAILAGEV